MISQFCVATAANKEALSEIGLPRLWQVVERPLETFPTRSLNVRDDVTEHVPNGGSEQRQNNNHNYGY